jgi:hypothetical protein
MSNVPEPPAVLAALRNLSLAEVEALLANLDAERAALSLLRRSLAARERARRRAAPPARQVQQEAPYVAR